MIIDRIQKEVLLWSSLECVWQAVSDAKNFGAWFGVEFEGPFIAGVDLRGRIVPTKVDPEVAKLQEPHTGKPFQIFIEEVTPMIRFAFRWHPFAIDPNHDYSSEKKTLVSFDVAEVNGGTQLTITESGFDQIPIERRSQAFHANDGGWTHQSRLIAKFLGKAT
jgi:uncharacterized protein YndB with AHSA1/START domain